MIDLRLHCGTVSESGIRYLETHGAGNSRGHPFDVQFCVGSVLQIDSKTDGETAVFRRFDSLRMDGVGSSDFME